MGETINTFLTNHYVRFKLFAFCFNLPDFKCMLFLTLMKKNISKMLMIVTHQGIDDGQWHGHLRIEISVLGELKPVKMVKIIMRYDYIMPNNSN